jgi:hypothetical protein
MKKAIVWVLVLCICTQCRNGAENAPRLGAARLTELNRRLGEKALAPRVLVNKIEISCQQKAKALGRDLTRLEYLTILRDEHLAALPEEMQGQPDALDNLMAGAMAVDTLAQLLAANGELTLPLPNVSGPVWISITREGLAENRQQGKAVLGWLEGEKLIDETEREKLGQTIETSNLLFGHQAYDLILRGLRTGDAAPDVP